jgi:DNA-binding Lrp family transcriptional regulator
MRNRSATEPFPTELQAPLHLLSEQAAIPLDQLARLLDLPLASTISRLQGLDQAGLIEHRRFLVRDHPWFWPSRRGARLAGTGFHYQRPEVAILAHRRAVNEIRIHLAERAPEGRWICEREVFNRRDPDEHLPDAVLEIDGERHAIEAELSRKRSHELRQILALHSRRYDAVIYFCGPRTQRLMERIRAEGRWPKLVVMPLPKAPA